MATTYRTGPAIKKPYLLLTHIPYFVDGEGGVWLEQLWHRDLIQHLAYLKDFTLAAPEVKKADQPNLVRVDPPEDTKFSVLPLPRYKSFLGLLLQLPAVIARLWSGIGKHEIIHSGVIGWPLPLGWIANPIALIRGKQLLLVVESAPWRKSGSIRPTWRKSIRARLTEFFARYFINRADLAFFTQPSYRNSLMTSGRGQGHIVPASWINTDEVLSAEEGASSWERKRVSSAGDVRLFFPAQLNEQKGVRILLAALRILDREGATFRIDIIGDGVLRQECLDAKPAFKSLRYDVLEPVPYGAPFFDLVREYHALLVPSLSDEQPRIIYDANSQGVPIIGSDTDGIRPFVEHEKTGWLVARNDAEALAATLQAAAESYEKLREYGLNALEFARPHTHERMHEIRWKITQELFGDSVDGQSTQTQILRSP